MIGATGCCCRKLMIDEWLFRACKATNKSYGLLSYVCNIETRLPRRLRIVAQRTAVILFPEREFGGAGVTIPIRMASSALHGTRAEARPYVAPIRRVEVSIVVVN